jgi:hypothetical protein
VKKRDVRRSCVGHDGTCICCFSEEDVSSIFCRAIPQQNRKGETHMGNAQFGKTVIGLAVLVPLLMAIGSVLGVTPNFF